jgi:hypothetical protein
VILKPSNAVHIYMHTEWLAGEFLFLCKPILDLLQILVGFSPLEVIVQEGRHIIIIQIKNLVFISYSHH